MSVIGALMLAALVGSGPPADRTPIYLTTTAVEGGVRFQVVGDAASPYRASFFLEVNGEGNQSRHQGSAELQAGARVVLSTVTVGVPPRGRWRARLRVEPAGAEPYEQVAASN